MSGHTPGPWVLSKDGSSERNNQANCISGADGTLIVYGQANDSDARLIAAATDMLEALKFLVECSAPMTGQQDQCWISIRAAIAKATGEAT